MPISPSPSYSGVVTTNSWGPYANAKDFKGNVLMILSIIFCTVLLFLAFNSIIRFLFCANCTLSTTSNSNSNSNDEHHEELEDPAADHKPLDNMRACTAAPETMIMVFSKQMGAAAAECAICLSEFVEGDEIRVLAACNHVFHVRCVDKWLALRCSCPTCRSSTTVINCATTTTSVIVSGTTYGNGSVENV